jgi:nitroreductase
MPNDIGLFEAMYTQKAIRRLRTDPVPDDIVRRLIEAATKAPSGGDRQPWAFIVIRENQEAKEKIAAWYRDAWDMTYGQIPQTARDKFEPGFARVYKSAEHLAYHLAEAPAYIIVCAVRPVFPPGAESIVAASHYGSVFPAVQNLLLAARGLGIGATLTTLHKMHDAEVKELLGIPENMETVALIPIGYPVGKYGPTKRKPIDEVLHLERWNRTKA